MQMLSTPSTAPTAAAPSAGARGTSVQRGVGQAFLLAAGLLLAQGKQLLHQVMA